MGYVREWADAMTGEVPELRLCSLLDLPDGESREGVGFSADLPNRPGIFVVRTGREVKAFINRCPHLGTPLNWIPNRFLDLAQAHIVCATHGAVFRIADGVCLWGPCLGDALETVPAEVRNGEVYVVDWQQRK